MCEKNTTHTHKDIIMKGKTFALLSEILIKKKIMLTH